MVASAPATAGASPNRRGFWLAAAALVALAAALRFYRLGAYELWMDEGVSFEMATAGEFTRALLRENSPPVYYVLQRLWLAPFGESEAALRSLSALCGTLFVAAMIAAGRSIWSPAVGLWSGALASLAPLHVYYSQEARPYALVSLALALALASLWRAVQTGGRARWLVYAGCALLALATHYFAILVIAPAGLLIVLWPDAEQRARARRGYAAATLLALVPWLAWLGWSLLGSPHPRGAHDWIARIWENTPPALAIPKSLEVLLLGSQAHLVPGFFKQFTDLAFPPGWRAAGLIALALLWGAALAPWGEARLGIGRCGWRKAWLGALAFAPLLALWLVSWVRPYYVVGRYDLVALPAQLLLLGFALAKLQKLPRFGPALAAGAALLLFAAQGAKLALYHRAPPLAGPSARATARALDAGAGDGDLVVLSAWRGIPVHYYLRRLGYRRSGERCEKRDVGRAFLCPRISPDDESTVLDFDHPDRVAFSPEAARADLRALVARIEPGRHAVWVEQRRAPPSWRAWVRMASGELARAGLLPQPGAPALERLRFERLAAGGPTPRARNR